MARRLAWLGLLAVACVARRPEPRVGLPADPARPAVEAPAPPPPVPPPPAAEPVPEEPGLQAGDIVREVNGVAVEDEAGGRILTARSWSKRGAVRLTVDRGGARVVIRLKRRPA